MHIFVTIASRNRLDNTWELRGRVKVYMRRGSCYCYFSSGTPDTSCLIFPCISMNILLAIKSSIISAELKDKYADKLINFLGKKKKVYFFIYFLYLKI